FRRGVGEVACHCRDDTSIVPATSGELPPDFKWKNWIPSSTTVLRGSAARSSMQLRMDLTIWSLSIVVREFDATPGRFNNSDLSAPRLNASRGRQKRKSSGTVSRTT